MSTNEGTDLSCRTSEEPIAIIGIGCRLPGGGDGADKFWALLKEGRDCIREVPPDRYNADAFYDPVAGKAMKAITRWGGFVQRRVDEFDAAFFGISPREAACLDPLQRWLLEVSWEALEDGGQIPKNLAGANVGVFIGGFTLDNTILQFNENNRQHFEAHTATGTALTLLSARLSYFYDFRGPCFSVDTACSSSLVAVHLACQSIWNKESSLALAGGANVMFTPEHTIAESKAGMLSPDGRCKTFDASANGYVRGEGVGIVVLKPLAKALEDKDPIYAVIRGTSCNQDGFSNGITVPNGQAQEAAIREACRRAGIVPGQVQYVEAHGTGTPVGDPIEAKALANALAEGRPEGHKCLVGSVKTNIGHTEAVAGVAGLIKAALALKHRQLPPNLHFKTPNPKIDFDDLCVEVVRELRPWPESDRPAVAGVNSFGFGGTNAHVILEEAPKQQSNVAVEKCSGQPYLLPLSARSPESLKLLAAEYGRLLTDGASGSLYDICRTASQRRTHHAHRALFLGDSAQQLSSALETYLQEDNRETDRLRLKEGESPRLACVFSGMGPQWWGMGRQLWEKEVIFRQTIAEIDELFTACAGWSLQEAMLQDEATSRMADTAVAQPANFALQVGVYNLLRARGIEVDGIVGHSAGEVAAAYAAGMMSLETAVRVIYHRSRLQQQTTGQGKLMAVGLSLDDAKAVLGDLMDRLSVAAINGPSAMTLAGDNATLEQASQRLAEQNAFARILNVTVPFHSHYMNPLKGELLEALSGLDLRPADIPLYSTVTGERLHGPEMDAMYWWKNVREPVYFAKAAQSLFADGYDVFLEISPHPVLGGSLRECMLAADMPPKVIIPTLRRLDDEQALLHKAVSAVYESGCSLVWDRIYPQAGDTVRLPSYPWLKERYWKETDASRRYRFGDKPHPLLGQMLDTPHPAWEVEIDTRHLPYLQDHCIQGAVVFPGAGFVEMALGAARQAFAPQGATSAEIAFQKALFLKPDENAKLRISIDRRDASFEIHGYPKTQGGPWVLHAAGRLSREEHISTPDKKVDLDAVRQRCQTSISPEACYRQFRKIGLEYGETFRGIDRFWQGDHEALAQIRIHDQVVSQADDYQIHPAVLDVCFQVLAAALPFADENEKPTVYMPTGVQNGRMHAQPKSGMWIYANVTEKNDQRLMGDIRLCDDAGRIVVEIKGCRAVILEEGDVSGLRRQPQDLYEVQWIPEENPAEDVISPQDPEERTWVVFADRQGVADDVIPLLQESGAACIRVDAGAEYQHLGTMRYQVDPESPADFQALLADIHARMEGQAWGIAHLWSLDIAPAASLDRVALEDAERLGPLGIMHLVQAVTEAGISAETRLWLVTRGAQRLPGDSPGTIAVGQCPVWGLGRLIGHQEHPALWGGMIDLDPRAPHTDASMLAERITRANTEDECVFRDGRPYISRLRPCEQIGASLPQRFQPNTACLITGGFGSLGLLVARWLARHGARHLILLGRTPLPPRETWHQIASGEPLYDAVTCVQELEAMGVRCYPLAADVTDKEALADSLAVWRQEAALPIVGAIHCAGLARPQLLVNLTAEDFRAVQRIKTLGAWNLHQLMMTEPLAFFTLFSSVASVVTSPGQSDYAAGNAFLDGLAHYRRAMGLPALSLNWGPWGEVGMATQFEDLNEYFDRRGMYPMTNEHGLEAFARTFGQDIAQVLVISANWPVVKDMNYPMGMAPALISDVVAAGREGGAATDEDDIDFLEDVLRPADPAEHIPLTANFLLNLIARVLRLNQTQRERLTPDDPLDGYGLDSMMAIEMVNLIALKLGVTVAVMDLMNGLSAMQLAAKLIEHVDLGTVDA